MQSAFLKLQHSLSCWDFYLLFFGYIYPLFPSDCPLPLPGSAHITFPGSRGKTQIASAHLLGSAVGLFTDSGATVLAVFAFMIRRVRN